MLAFSGRFSRTCLEGISFKFFVCFIFNVSLGSAPKRKNFDIQHNTRVGSGGQFTSNRLSCHQMREAVYTHTLCGGCVSHRRLCVPPASPITCLVPLSNTCAPSPPIHSGTGCFPLSVLEEGFPNYLPLLNTSTPISPQPPCPAVCHGQYSSPGSGQRWSPHPVSEEQAHL